MSRRKTREEFIEKANEIHNNLYDYSLVEYINNTSKVKIICSIHGMFEQTPYGHLRGKGCDRCGGTITHTKDTFITKAREVHGDLYDYSLTDYINNKTKVKMVCPIHGVFEQRPDNHFHGFGCSKCSGLKRHTIVSFTDKAKEAHGDRYDYSLVEYVNIDTKVKIICPIHGIFEQRPHDHFFPNSNGCPKCVKHISCQEMEFANYIKSVYSGTIITNTRKIIYPYEIDVYLPDINKAFEYNGEYWHEEGVRKPIGYHQMKTDRCASKGVELMHVWERDWMTNRESVFSQVAERLL